MTAGGLAALGPVGVAAAAAFAGYELMTLPQHIGSIEGGMLAAAQPALDLKEQVYGLARAGGFSGNSVLATINAGKGRVPGWMADTGMGPEDAVRYVSQLGLVPNSERNFYGAARAMRDVDFNPGLSGVGDAARGTLREMARTGGVSPDESSIRRMATILGTTMQEAQAKGMDRSSLLRSIDSGIAMMRRSGAGALDEGGLARFFSRFAGTPGGNTGEAGLQQLAGLNGATDAIGEKPVQSMMAYTVGSKLRSRADISKFLGGDAKLKSLEATAGGQRAVTNLLQAVKQGDGNGIAYWTGVISRGNEYAQDQIFANPDFYRGMNQEQADRAGAVSAGSKGHEIDFLNRRYGEVDQKGQASAAQTAHDILRAKGWSEANVDGMLGYMRGESRLNPDAFNPDGGGLGARGVGQWRGDRILAFRKKYGHDMLDPAIPRDQRLREQVEFMSYEMTDGKEKTAGDMLRNSKSAEASAWNMTAAFGRPGAAKVKELGDYYAGLAGQYAAQFGDKTSPAENRTPEYKGEAEAKQAVMDGAMNALSNMNTILPTANTALGGLATAADKAMAALNRIGRWNPGNMQQSPMPN